MCNRFHTAGVATLLGIGFVEVLSGGGGRPKPWTAAVVSTETAAAHVNVECILRSRCVEALSYNRFWNGHRGCRIVDIVRIQLNLPLVMRARPGVDNLVALATGTLIVAVDESAVHVVANNGVEILFIAVINRGLKHLRAVEHESRTDERNIGTRLRRLVLTACVYCVADATACTVGIARCTAFDIVPGVAITWWRQTIGNSGFFQNDMMRSGCIGFDGYRSFLITTFGDFDGVDHCTHLGKMPGSFIIPLRDWTNMTGHTGNYRQFKIPHSTTDIGLYQNYFRRQRLPYRVYNTIPGLELFISHTINKGSVELVKTDLHMKIGFVNSNSQQTLLDSNRKRTIFNSLHFYGRWQIKLPVARGIRSRGCIGYDQLYGRTLDTCPGPVFNRT